MQMKHNNLTKIQKDQAHKHAGGGVWRIFPPHAQVQYQATKGKNLKPNYRVRLQASWGFIVKQSLHIPIFSGKHLCTRINCKVKNLFYNRHNQFRQCLIK
mmetsp:Transcript_6956/g.11609  ORF Transcript_6956/g.11609 Transcript_6956/m.11609 type:complete len:100 (+) Transcript_6956:220-519(+)